MIIARQLQLKNRAEYLLYMWQVEDIMRLYGCNADRIADEYLSRFDVDDATAQEMRQWYADLCEMMRSEGKQENGHLQINNNVVIGFADLNEQLLESEKYPFYKQMYYKVLPYVVELRAKASAANNGSQPAASDNTPVEAQELFQLFEFLYGVMLLRMQQKAISEATERAAADISALLGQLADYWKEYKAGNLKFE